MSGVVLDANALLSFWTDRHLEQQKRVRDLFAKAFHDGGPVFIPRHVLAEAVFVLLKVYDVPPDTVHDLLSALLEAPGLDLVDDPPLGDVLAVWPSRVRDFGDAVVLAAARSLRAPILTFDAALRRILKREQIPTI